MGDDTRSADKPHLVAGRPDVSDPDAAAAMLAKMFRALQGRDLTPEELAEVRDILKGAE